MTDNLSIEQRRKNMQNIKGKNTSLELIVRKFLFKNGLRFRINLKELPGKPDIVLKKYHSIVQVNGCFWHNHDNCKLAVLPKSNIDYWKDKISKNKSRDIINKERLKELGWKVFEIWECEIKSNLCDNKLSKLVDKIKKELN